MKMEMSKKVFKRNVYIKVPVEVTLDDEVFTEEFLENFSQYIHDVDDLGEIADFVASNVAIFDNPSLDMIGTPLVDGKVPHGVEEKYVNKAVNVKFPYFKYDNRVIGDMFLDDAFEDCQ